jgi:putative Holliday junction resolvase
MGRILAIDFGKKRTGLAVTDPLQIIASGLETVDSKELIGYLKKYFATEIVDKVLIGYPLNWDDTPTDATPLVDKFLKQFQHVFPNMRFELCDERFTSKMATDAMLQMGLKKKARANKALIDEISATIILQEYLQSKN